MNILVTGGCGFIGSNFINYIIPKYPNYKIVNLDILYYCADKNNIHKKVQQNPNYEFIKGNINDVNLLNYIIKNKQIDCIIHFAAQSHVDNSFDDSLQYTEDNIKGTHTLLEVVRKSKRKIKFLHFSTDEVYGESQLQEQPKHEMSILCPTNPYAASKAAAEMLVNSYLHSYRLPCIITRCNNVYGPNQYPEKLIPKFIQQLQNNQKCTIHGDGSSLRSFIHAYDVATAVDVILHKGVIGEIYNIGSEPDQEKSVLEVTKMLIKKIKKSDLIEPYVEYVTDRPFNDKRYFITNQKLKELGWKQTISFEKGIQELLK